MKGTALGVQFNLDDSEDSLTSTYEVIGTSDNYSFQYNLGKGSDIAGEAGGEVYQSINLEGNYGDFAVRVFAVSDIGIRSSFIETGITISPPDLNGTFTFSDLRISNTPEDAQIGQTIISLPFSGQNLVVQNEFIGRDPTVEWELVPPPGHPKEGQSLGQQLASDGLFDKFEITLKKGDGTTISSSTLNDSAGLKAFLNTSYVSETLDSYSGFSLPISDLTHSELGFDRSFSMEVVCHDYFGRTCTGILSGINPRPVINNSTSNLVGNKMNISLNSLDTDYIGSDIRYLGFPDGLSLYDESDLYSSQIHFDKLRSSEIFDPTITANYASGTFVEFSGKIYKCKQAYSALMVRGMNPIDDTDYWDEVYSGPASSVTYIFDSGLYVEQDSAGWSNEQNWGWSYAYSANTIDSYGHGLKYNSSGHQMGTGSLLGLYKAALEIEKLRFEETEGGGFLFRWNLVDGQGNPADISDYVFMKNPDAKPTTLGLSGSFFDVDSNIYLTGLVNGVSPNFFDSRGNLVEGIPNTTTNNSYEWTRSINNSIYGTGGWPEGLSTWSPSSSYSPNQLVTDEVGDFVWKSILPSSSPPYAKLYYEEWNAFSQSNGDYLYNHSSPFSDTVLYSGNLYAATGDGVGGMGTLGVDIDPVTGLYDQFRDYQVGDMIIAPGQEYPIYNPHSSYSNGDYVLYSGTAYSAKVDLSASSHSTPPENIDSWDRLNSSGLALGLYSCSAVNGPSLSSGILPSTGVDHWTREYPNTLTGWTKIADEFQLSGNNVRLWQGNVEYNSGDFVLYNNDIWSGLRMSENILPSTGTGDWSNTVDGHDISLDYSSGEIVLYENNLYVSQSDNPTGAPILNLEGSGDLVNSSYTDSQFIPFWELTTGFSDVLGKNIGIPQSGKRSVRLELGIVSSDGENVSSINSIDANNPAPLIKESTFAVDSLGQTSTVKFDFQYVFGGAEKTTKIELYRSSTTPFSILDENGLPGTGASTFVKSVEGSPSAGYGENITQIIDSPPIANVDGVEVPTGYYYKILPYDTFGSGVLHDVEYAGNSLVNVYPKNFHTSNPGGLDGPIYQRSEGDLPGVVVNFNGETAFENYFLDWEVPYSGDTSVGRDLRANNISHYELWQSSSDKITIGPGVGPTTLTKEMNWSGHRKVRGHVASSGPIPTVHLDPASGFLNATQVMSVDARSPLISVSHRGKVNDKRYFWVRAVDFGGNKGPFTGKAGTGDEIEGLELILGQAKTTDIADFEQNITQTFPNTVALVPNNPFEANDPTSTSISWNRHFLYNNGTGYVVGESSTTDQYVYWTGSAVELTSEQSGILGLQTGHAGAAHEYPNLSSDINNPLRSVYYSGNYNTVDYHPAGEGGQGNDNGSYLGEYDKPSVLGENDFIIARNAAGTPTPMWNAFANATIGTAHIQNAAITNAKIHNITADKIRSASIEGQDIQVGGTLSGQIRSSNFGEPVAVEGWSGFDGINASGRGFAISGNGNFVFKGSNGKLFLEDDTLKIEGRIRQTDGSELTLVNISAEPDGFAYAETADGLHVPDSYSQESLITARFQNTDLASNQVKWKMVRNSDNYTVFDYGDHTMGGSYGISGFTWETSEAGGHGVVATAKFISSGFHYITQSQPIAEGGLTSDSVQIFASGLNTSTEHSVTISQNSDGAQGETGRSPVFRGGWKPSTDYKGARDSGGNPTLRGDVVYYAAGYDSSYYFICLEDHTSHASAIDTDVDARRWETFGAEFESVATKLLLAEDAIITRTLSMGTYDPEAINNGNGGTISTAGITWSSSEELPTGYGGTQTPTGFIFTNDNGQPRFWIGSGHKAYLKYDDARVELVGTFINNTRVDGDIDEYIADISQTNSDPFAIFVGGGYNNKISMLDDIGTFDSVGSSIVGGAYNEISGRFSFVGNGFKNVVADNFSAIVGGWNNKMPLLDSGSFSANYNDGCNFIGAGQLNQVSGEDVSFIGAGYDNSIAHSSSSSMLSPVKSDIRGLTVADHTGQWNLGQGAPVFLHDPDNSWLGWRFLGDHHNRLPVEKNHMSHAGWFRSQSWPCSGLANMGGHFWASSLGQTTASNECSHWIFQAELGGWIYLVPNSNAGLERYLYQSGVVALEDDFLMTWDARNGYIGWLHDTIYDGVNRSDSIFSSDADYPANAVDDEGLLCYHFASGSWIALTSDSVDGLMHSSTPHTHWTPYVFGV